MHTLNFLSTLLHKNDCFWSLIINSSYNARTSYTHNIVEFVIQVSVFGITGTIWVVHLFYSNDPLLHFLMLQESSCEWEIWSFPIYGFYLYCVQMTKKQE